MHGAAQHHKASVRSDARFFFFFARLCAGRGGNAFLHRKLPVFRDLLPIISGAGVALDQPTGWRASCCRCMLHIKKHRRMQSALFRVHAQALDGKSQRGTALLLPTCFQLQASVFST